MKSFQFLFILFVSLVQLSKEQQDLQFQKSFACYASVGITCLTKNPQCNQDDECKQKFEAFSQCVGDFQAIKTLEELKAYDSKARGTCLTSNEPANSTSKSYFDALGACFDSEKFEDRTCKDWLNNFNGVIHALKNCFFRAIFLISFILYLKF